MIDELACGAVAGQEPKLNRSFTGGFHGKFTSARPVAFEEPRRPILRYASVGDVSKLVEVATVS